MLIKRELFFSEQQDFGTEDEAHPDSLSFYERIRAGQDSKDSVNFERE